CTSYQSGQSEFKSENDNDAPKLEQNVPNPFMQTSYIKFYIPSSAKSAMIVVSDINGTAVKQFNSLAIGFCTVNIAAGTLAAGTYQYTLIIDGNKIDTKQMILTK
ncbi:MAG TPA: T9SS type A sorting domain-containing protein, partial [Chitinophagales bacterium]|nr:T9SS type A sorting domain-containing protein [Chitinophagales bacterium]